jgi:hypothetical protein
VEKRSEVDQLLDWFYNLTDEEQREILEKIEDNFKWANQFKEN